MQLHRREGQGDGLAAKWMGARVFRFSCGELEQEGAGLWPAGARSTEISFPFRLDSLRAEVGARE